MWCPRLRGGETGRRASAASGRRSRSRAAIIPARCGDTVDGPFAGCEAPAIFAPATHDAGLLQEFVNHHGAAKVDAYFGEKQRLAPSDFQLPKDGQFVHQINDGKLRNDTTFNYAHWRFNAMGPVLQCPPSIFTVFGHGDEEKRICGLPSDAAAQATIGASSPCVIISLGSANMWGFETAVHARMPHCVLHTLDCTVQLRVPASLRGVVVPHQICLGAENGEQDSNGGKVQFMTWRSFAAHINLDRPPVALKMDIEGYEWSILTQLAVDSELLPLSISLELHYMTSKKYVGLDWRFRSRSPYEIGAFMDFMFTRGGYSLVDRHDNMFCKHCSEIVIARV